MGCTLWSSPEHPTRLLMGPRSTVPGVLGGDVIPTSTVGCAPSPLKVDAMVEPNIAESKPNASPTAEAVTTRVNVAFPFSQIKIQEPSEDLAALAALVREVAEMLADVAPGPKAQTLKKRAQVLAARLK